MKRKALGRGLEALLSPSDGSEATGYEGRVSYIDIEDIMANEFQPRIEFDKEKIEALADSIRQSGLIQPIIVRKIGTKYEIIAGERRFRALKLLKEQKIPCIIKDADDPKVLELALIENIHREDLNPIEEALAYDNLIKRFNYTQEQVAEKVGKDRSTITNMLRLLKLPKELQDMLKRGEISTGHAKVLLSISSPEKQKALALRVVKDGLSVRELERLIRQEQAKAKRKKVVEKSPFVKDLERQISERYQIRVKIREENGHGKIEFPFSSLQELDIILDRLLS